MSLKVFHALFIVAATILVLFCGLQAYGSFRTSGSLAMAMAAVGSLVLATLLVRYEAEFLRRCREAGIR